MGCAPHEAFPSDPTTSQTGEYNETAGLLPAAAIPKGRARLRSKQNRPSARNLGLRPSTTVLATPLVRRSQMAHREPKGVTPTEPLVPLNSSLCLQEGPPERARLNQAIGEMGPQSHHQVLQLDNLGRRQEWSDHDSEGLTADFPAKTKGLPPMAFRAKEQARPRISPPRNWCRRPTISWRRNCWPEHQFLWKEIGVPANDFLAKKSLPRAATSGQRNRPLRRQLLCK